MLETLLVSLLGSIICITAVDYLMQIAKVYAEVQSKMCVHNSRLIARHYLHTDLAKADFGVKICAEDMQACAEELPESILRLIDQQSIKESSAVLVIYQQQQRIIYYLRKSIIPCVNKDGCYALYRDDGVQQASALVENMQTFAVQIEWLHVAAYRIKLSLAFDDRSILEITCVKYINPMAVF